MSKIMPLQLKDLVFPTLSVDAVPMAASAYSTLKNPKEIDLEAIDIGFLYAHDEGAPQVTAGMIIRTKEAGPGEGAPYQITIKAFAEFGVWMPEANDPNALRMRRYAAATTLMGAIREQIATITARGPWGTAWLPLVNVEMIAATPEPNVTQPTQPVRKAAVRHQKTK